MMIMIMIIIITIIRTNLITIFTITLSYSNPIYYWYLIVVITDIIIIIIIIINSHYLCTGLHADMMHTLVEVPAACQCAHSHAGHPNQDQH